MLSSSKRARPTSRRNEATHSIHGSFRPLRIVTFLAPNLLWFYEFVSRYLEKKLTYPAKLSVGSDYAQLAGGADIAFVCGLPYVEHPLTNWPGIEPLAAPVLCGQRYHCRPIYFSEVIVRKERPFRSFADLRGCSWAYNEPHSQSGYGILRHHLNQMGETFGYFSRVIETGYHERSVHMVYSGEVDASAIDSHVLALLMRDHAPLARELRVIDTFGPSTIQPIVAGKHLPRSLRCDIRAALLEMSDDQTAKPALTNACIERFVRVSDSDYDDIRRMLAVAQE
jgi:ABC-type phosphate/phosphonate transport system substrate-binding protein